MRLEARLQCFQSRQGREEMQKETTDKSLEMFDNKERRERDTDWVA